MQVCNVEHIIPNSFGISLSIRRPHNDSIFKLTFSGDTIPCDSLIKIGSNSTVLIHEATFEDDLESLAIRTQHSTVSQAIAQGDKMNAKHTILTHFSQRHNSLMFDTMAQPLPPNVTIAFDNMELVESDLPLSHHFYRVSKCIYREALE